MELGLEKTLREQLEKVFDVEAKPYKSLSHTAREINEIKESFVLPNHQEIEYGIQGQIRVYYISQGYREQSDKAISVLSFVKDKQRIYINLTSSDSRTIVSVLEL